MQIRTIQSGQILFELFRLGQSGSKRVRSGLLKLGQLESEQLRFRQFRNDDADPDNSDPDN